MNKLNPTKNKHLTLDERIEIQECLDKEMSFKAIAKRISKDPTTVSKEVKKHLLIKNKNVNTLSDASSVQQKKICPYLLRAPYVCNGCKKRHYYCGFQKQLYNAKNAQKEYSTLLSEAREGIPLNKEEFYEIDRIVSEGIKKGQHLYHILQSNDLNVSKSTIYRHLNKGYLSVSKTDFPRVVKFKRRSKSSGQFVPKAAKIGRTYNDFQSFITDNNITSWVEMDTVIGRIGGKAILTFDFTFCNFMFGLLIDNKTAASVSEKITELKINLSENDYTFGDIFPVILTDNGGEFSDIHSIELDLNKNKETSLFFCDPQQSSQKPRVEKNHTLFRDIVPKGESFDDFTQETVNLIFSHVNGVKRKSLFGKTPFDMFVFAFGETVAKILGIEFISANEVIQSPKLLKK